MESAPAVNMLSGLAEVAVKLALDATSAAAASTRMARVTQDHHAPLAEQDLHALHVFPPSYASLAWCECPSVGLSLKRCGGRSLTVLLIPHAGVALVGNILCETLYRQGYLGLEQVSRLI